MAIGTGTAILGGALLGTVGSAIAGNKAAKGAKQAANIQAQAGQQAIDILREDLAPFTGVGAEAAGQLMGNILQPQAAAQITAQDVLSDPFFQAISQSQERGTLAERAALGLAGSGGTQDILQRNLLQLGEGFRQSRQAEATNLQNQALQQQQARFNQLFNIAGMGQASAAQQAQQTAGITTDIGTAQSTVPLVKAQGQSQLIGNLANLGGLALGANAGMFGGGAGAGAGNVLGAGGAVSPFGGIPTGGSPLQNFTASMTP